MLRAITQCVAVASAAVVIAAGCGSSSSTSGRSGTSGGVTLTVGLLTDVTGLAASGNSGSVQGVEAGIARATNAGYHIKYVVADTQSSPSGALSAATRLVQSDHVSAVIAISALTFAAAPFLRSQGIPVVGANIDGIEWLTSPNMFSVFGYVNEAKVPSGIGKLFHMQGGTVIGTLGYGISPSSAESAKGTAISAKAAGLKVGYTNTSFQFGSTNVQPVALAMKAAGVNAVYSSTDPNTSFALVTALGQLGDNVKVAEFPDGYGGDLTQAGPGALQSAQNAIFGLTFEPVEMHTAATEHFVADLASLGVKSEPGLADYEGYASVAALVSALTASGGGTKPADLISALSGVKNFTADGLLGDHGYNLSDRTGTAAGPDGCIWYTRLVGSAFQLVSNADPLCGPILTGVSAGS